MLTEYLLCKTPRNKTRNLNETRVYTFATKHNFSMLISVDTFIEFV